MKNIFNIFLLLSQILPIYAQSHADCIEAIELTIPIDTVFSLKCSAPQDSGKLNEFHADSHSPYYFDKEHASHWYHFAIPVDAFMTLEITPNEHYTDYDFLLFQEIGSNSCERISQQKTLPIRSIISRNDSSIDSKTGLSFYANQAHIASGINPSYGRFVSVKKGEHYYLAIDNFTKNGTGYTLTIKLFFLTQLQGKVIDVDTRKPLPAKVSVQNLITQNPVFELNCDSLGYYGEKLLPSVYEKYQILYHYDGYFSAFRQEDYLSLLQNEGKPINIELKKIKVGASITLENLYYEGGLAVLLPRSQPQLNVLLQQMRQYPTLKIKIEGHANCVQVADTSNVLQLSADRAKVIKDFLVQNGIAPDRVETVGYGCQYQVSTLHYDKNRRVEMKVLDF